VVVVGILVGAERVWMACGCLRDDVLRQCLGNEGLALAGA
jgi:hypothetical protein